jgi:FMN phosphatase YigB (HAD superfamily)
MNRDSSTVRKWYFNHFYPAFISTIRNHATPRPQLNEVFLTLKKQGVTLVLFSDYSHITERLSALKIENTLFDMLLSGEDEGALKPHPRPIEIITKKYNISKSEILIVGDRQETDGEFAKKSDIDSIIIKETPDDTKTLSWNSLVSMILTEGKKK